MLKPVIKDFGNEWKTYNQASISSSESTKIYNMYFNLIDLNKVEGKALGIDLGCGSGRWAKIVSRYFNNFICLDASFDALEVSKQNLSSNLNCQYINASIEKLPLKSNKFDFVYSLGVIHHIENVEKSFEMAARILKRDKPFLVYLYYNFENRTNLFKFLWRLSNFIRKIISQLPFKLKKIVTDLIALFVYLPISRTIKLMLHFNPRLDLSNMPLNFYQNLSFYTMRTDSLDRFGTKLEKRFSKVEIETMFYNAGFYNISFSSEAPYWCAIGYKK